MSVKLLDKIRGMVVNGGVNKGVVNEGVNKGLPLRPNSIPVPPVPLRKLSRVNYISFGPLGFSNFVLPDTLKTLESQFRDLLALYSRIKDTGREVDYTPVLMCPDNQAEMFEYLYTHGDKPLGFRRVVNDHFRLYEIETWEIVLNSLERVVNKAKEDYQNSIKESHRLFLICGQWVELFELMKVYSERKKNDK